MRYIAFYITIIGFLLSFSNKAMAKPLDCDTVFGYGSTGNGYWVDTDGDSNPDTVYTYSGCFHTKWTRDDGSITDTVLVLKFTPDDAGPLGCNPMLWYNNAAVPDTIFISTKTDTTISLVSQTTDLDTYTWTALDKTKQSRIGSDTSSSTTIVVPPKDTAVYVLTTTKISPEDYQMVFNGNFEQGNVGFNSDFTYKEKNDGTSSGSFGWGVYAIGVAPDANDPKYYCAGDFNSSGWAHYPTTGYPYLFADGKQVAGGQAFYSTTFSVETNQEYIFQAKFANLNSGGTFTNPGTDYAIFRFFVNDQPVSEYDTLKSTWGVWQSLYTTFNTGNDTLATVTVKNFGVSTDGNDFCLDDVSFLKYCSTSDTIVIINDMTLRTKIDAEICDNQQYTFHDKILTTEGYYIDTLHTSANIDSIVTLHLVVHPTCDTTIYDTICEDQSYVFNNQTYYASGDYTASLQTMDYGCDSIVHLHLVVNNKSYKTITETIKSWEDYYFEDSLIRDDGIYTTTLTNVAGCDSIITLTLSYEDKVYISESICEGEEFALGDKLLTTTGTYADTLTALNGNDSIVMLSLNVYPEYNDTITAKIGVGQVYDREGFYEDEKGIYTQENTSIHGCDSSTVLILDVDSPLNIYLPNAFTPNVEDGSENNVFRVISAEDSIVIESFRIYNRWGGIIFETTDITVGWDGTYKGEICKEGVYLYEVIYSRKGEGKQYNKTGEVFLMN